MTSTDENVKKIKEIVLKNRHNILRELDIAYGAAWHIVVEILRMRRATSRLVPKELDFAQKQHGNTAVDDMVSEANNDPTFMKRIIIGN